MNRDGYQSKLQDADAAVKIVRSGDRVYVGAAASIAYALCQALYRRRDALENVTVLGAMTGQILPFFKTEAKGHFHTLTWFAGAGERYGIQSGQTDFTSFHLGQIEQWMEQVGRPNVAFFEVSPPDDEGWCSFGALGPAIHSYVAQRAERIVLQVNRSVPRVCGESHRIHISQADAIVEADGDLQVVPEPPVGADVETLSKLVLREIPDGATIQLGIGSVSNAVGYGLRCKNDIGVHTEMYTDSMMHLQREGVITNKYTYLHPGKSVTAFAFGSKELYHYVDGNEGVYFAPLGIINDPNVIARNPRMISVNTAMSVDLFGQVAADAIGCRQVSAVGGQVEYVRGAQRSEGGKSIIALTSTMEGKSGRKSRIVFSFPAGTAITTARSDVQYVATEYGVVNLRPLPMRERVRAMIALAHPDFRNELTAQAKENHLI